MGEAGAPAMNTLACIVIVAFLAWLMFGTWDGSEL